MRSGVRYLAMLLVAALCACGGGGSSTAPRAASTPGGAGIAAVFNQKVTFVITVPPTSVTSTSARRARPTATATTPYVSPLTGSVELTLAEIDGVSPQQAPPAIAPVNVPAACQGSTAGCSIPVSNVPAALGTNRYFVQTYTGANATGTLISSGFVDVSVPAKGNAAIGGTAALSIGGYVAAITFSPTSLDFMQGTAQSAAVLVQASDAAGATIVGSGLFATPITLTLSDMTNFTIGGSTTYVINGPLAAPLTLHYGGGVSLAKGTIVTATSQNSAGNPVTAELLAQVIPPGSVVTATPTPIPGTSPTPATSPTPTTTSPPTVVQTAAPTPKPSPTVKPQTQSLYVADGNSDTVSEYRIVSQIEAGTIPNPTVTPSRVIKFNPANVKAGSVSNAGLSCASVEGIGNGTAGVAVDPTAGTVYILPNCTDGTNGYVFGFPSQATGAATPTIYDPFAGGGFGEVGGLALASSKLYAAYNISGTSMGVLGFPVTSTGKQPTNSIGETCYAEFGTPSPGCFYAYQAGIGVDSNGFLYVPGAWNDTPTGDASALLTPASIFAIQASKNNATVTPFSAIAGLNTAAGGSTAPLAATVDGSLLYALTGSITLTSAPPNNLTYFPGLSACPAPSSNAPINEVDVNDNGTTNCADQQLHLYLVAYNLTSSLLGINEFGTDVDLNPDYLVGGDIRGGFGCVPQIGVNGGQFLAASGGYVYVINLTSSNCAAATNPNTGVSPEIDVYNLNSANGISGAHTDIAPIFVLPLRSGLPLAIAIGPSGTATGGQEWLRKPPSPTYRPNLYGRRRAQRHPMRPGA